MIGWTLVNREAVRPNSPLVGGEITQKIKAITQFKVIQGHQFWYRRKAICGFLSVINANLHPISHCFEVIADHC